MTRALRLAVLPRRSQARSRMTRVEREKEEVGAAAMLERVIWRGVPVKAEAVVAITTASKRARMVEDDLMVVELELPMDLSLVLGSSSDEVFCGFRRRGGGKAMMAW